tara:strand:+ start:4518 stop:5435 length:918 start_codon:yes stop_codon:yes gene_type:complete
MPRNVWSVAGDEIQGFNNYLDKQGAEQTRADEYASMISLRKDSLLNQMNRQAAQEDRAKAQDAYNNQMMEFKKTSAAADANRHTREENEAKERKATYQKLSGLMAQRMAKRGEEGYKEVDNQEYVLMAMQSGAHPEDASKLYQMFKARGGANTPSLDEKFADFKRKRLFNNANPAPATERAPVDQRTLQQKNAQAMTSGGANALLAENMYNTDLVGGAYGGEPMEKDLMGIVDSRLGNSTQAINETARQLRDYRSYNSNPGVAERAVLKEHVIRMRASARLEPGQPTPRDFYVRAAALVTKAEAQ